MRELLSPVLLAGGGRRTVQSLATADCPVTRSPARSAHHAQKRIETLQRDPGPSNPRPIRFDSGHHNLTFTGAFFPEEGDVWHRTNATGRYGGGPADALRPVAGLQNVPGSLTHGFDAFNIHLHGLEVAPHLFHPMGTSVVESEWIELTPNASHGQQCYCYKFAVSPQQSRGDFLYHTHMHGTSSVLTWAGMFGMVYVGETSAAAARARLKRDVPVGGDGGGSSNSSLVHDLVRIADAEGLRMILSLSLLRARAQPCTPAHFVRSDV